MDEFGQGTRIRWIQSPCLFVSAVARESRKGGGCEQASGVVVSSMKAEGGIILLFDSLAERGCHREAQDRERASWPLGRSVVKQCRGRSCQ